jgi:hypothetical protein
MAFRLRLSTGTAVWLSALTKPCPGKCLPQLAMPARSRPCIRLLASSVTTRASRWKARSPMTLLAAVVEVEHRREAEVDAAGAQLGWPAHGRRRWRRRWR